MVDSTVCISSSELGRAEAPRRATFVDVSDLRTKPKPSKRIRQAVVMAGGKGTRLHPYSAVLPKPLMPLGDMPILELLIRRLKNSGVEEVILAVNHLRHLIEAYFGDGGKFGVDVHYCGEDHPLGTAGALGNMLDILDDDFYLMNGDLLTTIDLERMAQEHAAHRADASIGIYEREHKIDFGLIEVDSDGMMAAYREKPSRKYFVSMGLYILSREAVREHVAEVGYLDMPTLLLKIKDKNGKLHCFKDDCIWLDIGRPDDFAMAQEIFERNPDIFLEPVTI